MPGTATRSPETLCHRYRLPSLPLCLVMLHLQRANALHNAQSSLNWAPVTQRFLLTYPALPDFHNYATRFQSVTFRNLALGSKCCLSVCDSYHTDVLGLLHFCTGMTSGVKKKIWNSSTLFTANIKCAIKHTAQTLMAAWSPPREQRMYLERSSFFFLSSLHAFPGSPE